MWAHHVADTDTQPDTCTPNNDANTGAFALANCDIGPAPINRYTWRADHSAAGPSATSAYHRGGWGADGYAHTADASPVHTDATAAHGYARAPDSDTAAHSDINAHQHRAANCDEHGRADGDLHTHTANSHACAGNGDPNSSGNACTANSHACAAIGQLQVSGASAARSAAWTRV